MENFAENFGIYFNEIIQISLSREIFAAVKIQHSTLQSLLFRDAMRCDTVRMLYARVNRIQDLDPVIAAV